MVARQHLCDRNRLHRLLDEDLNENEERKLIKHLDACDGCREKLETMAAEPDWWSDASELLQIELDEDEFSGHIGPSDSTYLGLESPSLVDFSMDFLERSDNPAMLGRLGEYEILDVIGRGGFGVVLKGYDGELNRYVAVKVLAPHLASSAAARRRFAREAQAAAAVVHPHVVAIYSVAASARLPYLVMPLVGGQSLQQRIDRAGSLEIQEVLRIGFQAALGRAAAHAQGLVHRDVKPANILLEKDVDRVLLTDFGLARAADDASLTRSGFVPGTPQFMSPEQARGDATDHRSDLFSLGSVLYTACAGHPPFRAETMMGVLKRICENDPRPLREINPDIPDWLCRVIDRLLDKDPSGRFESSAVLARILEQCLAHVQQPTAVGLPEELKSTCPTRPVRQRAMVWWTALSGVAALVFMGALAWQLGSAASEGRRPRTSDRETGLPSTYA